MSQNGVVTWDWTGWAGGAGIKVWGSPLDEPEMPEQHVDTKHGLGITLLHNPLPQSLSSHAIIPRRSPLILDAFALSACLGCCLLLLPFSQDTDAVHP